MATGFTDKLGKPIHFDDIVQVGLDAKSRSRKRVARAGKHCRPVNENDPPEALDGRKLTVEQCKHTTVIDCPHRP